MDDSAPPAAALTRALCILVFVLMVAAMAYAAWIALLNWNHIGV